MGGVNNEARESNGSKAIARVTFLIDRHSRTAVISVAIAVMTVGAGLVMYALASWDALDAASKTAEGLGMVTLIAGLGVVAFAWGVACFQALSDTNGGETRGLAATEVFSRLFFDRAVVLFLWVSKVTLVSAVIYYAGSDIAELWASDPVGVLLTIGLIWVGWRVAHGLLLSNPHRSGFAYGAANYGAAIGITTFVSNDLEGLPDERRLAALRRTLEYVENAAEGDDLLERRVADVLEPPAWLRTSPFSRDTEATAHLISYRVGGTPSSLAWSWISGKPDSSGKIQATLQFKHPRNFDDWFRYSTGKASTGALALVAAVLRREVTSAAARLHSDSNKPST